MAVLRERYGFTAVESLDMSILEFEAWLEALVEDKSQDRGSGDDDEVWEAVSGK